MNTDFLRSQLRMSGWFLAKALEDITHDVSLRPTATGQTINWLVGHLADARGGALALLSGERAWPEAELAAYKRGADSLDPTRALPLSELTRRFDSVQEPLLQHLKSLTDERAAQKAPFSPSGNPDETVGSLMGVLAFHEVYHVGQVGMLRRLAGLGRVV
jgi:uncharacterized damage-inducible protein DinB